MSSMRSRFTEDGVDLSEEEWEDIRKRFLSEATKAAKHMDKMSKLFPEAMRELIRDLTGERDKDELDKDLLDKMVELEESDYEEIDLDKGIALPRQGKISWERVKSSSHSKQVYDEGRKSVAPTISKLKKKIRLYGNDQIYNIYNQKRGRLDKRRLHKIPMGVTDIFKAQIRKQDKPLDVCLLVDESGSMGYRCMDDARNAAIAVKEALCDNPMLNLWVFGHSADRKENGMTEMREYYSPAMKDRPFSMGDMRARCENRDGNAIVASANRVKEQTDQPHGKKLMIVFSDGSPSADRYRGETALKHVRKCVKYTEAKGWNIIQIGFSGAHEYYMKKMFTHWVYINDSNTLGDQTAKIIRKVLKI
jgi:nitric oxide reductase activation protein